MINKKLLLLCVGISVLSQIIYSQVPSYVPTNGLVGYWPLNGNANDQSGNGNNGTVNGATLTTDRLGNADSAYSFDGVNDLISTSDSNTLNISNNITMSAWVYDVSDSQNYHTILNKRINGNWSYGVSFSYYFGPGGSPTEINKVFSGRRNNFGAQTEYKFSNEPIVFGQWIHIVVKIENNLITFYKNGIDMGVNLFGNQFTIPMINQVVGLTIGSNGDGGEWFNGKLDDIGIWNRALSQQEITNMYNGVNYSDTCNAVSGSLTNGLVGYWPFCGNANDDSGNGNNGTVNGASLTADRFGNTNSAYSFDDSQIKINYSSDLVSQTQSISVWLKVNSLPSVSDPQALIYGKGWGFPQLVLRNNGKIYLSTMNSQSTATFIESNTNVIPGNWYHIIGFYSSDNFKLYVNGLLDNSILPSPNPVFYSYCNSEYWIGGFNHENSCMINDNTQKINGVIDDLGIWNRALTQQEITQLFNQNQCTTNITVTDTLIINVGQLSYTNPVTYANNITIYPNPANTQVNISFNNITDLTGGNINIVNSLGQQVATTPITLSGTNTTMALNSWGGTGLYFVQILNAQGIVVDVKKIILQ